MSVKDRVIFVPRGPRGPQGEQGEAGDPSLETARINVLENQSSLNDIHIGSTGNDLNTGTLANPVRTFDRVFDLIKTSSRNRVFILSDIEWEHNVTIYNIANLVFLKHNSVTGMPKLIIRDAVNHQTTSGRINIRNPISMAFQQLDIKLDTTRSGPFVFSNAYGSANIWIWSCTLESYSSNNGVFLGNSYAGNIRAYFQTIPLTNMEGKLFHGVAEGIDPNTRFGISTNLLAG